ncbi:histidine kinase dimerization/phosphoacceptor domain-containing protein [Dactylosporangium sp. NPDC051485]|uniref:sensor histidine kinase n=1 Tax=Dactylosporangium sp. NPDC051485 TaxID=3154846 RepID=UPI003421325C
MPGQVVTAARRLASRAALRDASLVAGLLAVVALFPGPRRAVVLWWIATGVAVIAVGLRNRWPVAMLAVSTVCVAVHVAQGSLIGGSDGAVLILVYTVAARRSPATSRAALAGGLLVLLFWNGYFALRGRPAPGVPSMSFHVDNAEPGAAAAFDRTALITGDRAGGAARWSGPAVLGGALVAAWAIGSGTRSRRAYLDQLAARARDLQREQDQRAALAMAAERGRISRELHDVVAHGLSLIVIQAQGGAAALDDQPAETRAALEAIVRTGRASLTDMRRVLDALGEVEDAWHPSPVTRTRAAAHPGRPGAPRRHRGTAAHRRRGRAAAHAARPVGVPHCPGSADQRDEARRRGFVRRRRPVLQRDRARHRDPQRHRRRPGGWWR